MQICLQRAFFGLLPTQDKKLLHIIEKYVQLSLSYSKKFMPLKEDFLVIEKVKQELENHKNHT
ncbi:MAG: hypothetical protein ACJARD_000483 [Alphaproteobacteria bacterium]